MNAIATDLSTETTILSSQKLGAFTRKAHKAGKDKPGWVAHVQEGRAERTALHKQREAELEAQRDQIEAMAQRIHEEKLRATASTATKPAPSKPTAYGNGRVRRTPEQEKAFRLLKLKSRLR